MQYLDKRCLYNPNQIFTSNELQCIIVKHDLVIYGIRIFNNKMNYSTERRLNVSMG